MNMRFTHVRMLAGVALALALLAAPVAQAASKSLADKHYLSGVAVESGDNLVTVNLGFKGTGEYAVSYLKKGIQLTIQDAFLMPAKQHIKVDHPFVREVFAYQYDPDTVRVRLLTSGISGSALRGQAKAITTPNGLRLTLMGLPVATKVTTTAKAKVAKVTATAKAKAAKVTPIAKVKAAKVTATKAKVAKVTAPAKVKASKSITTAKAKTAKVITEAKAATPVVKAIDKTAAVSAKVTTVATSPEAAPKVIPAIALPKARELALAELELMLGDADDRKAAWKRRSNPAEDVGEPSLNAMIGSDHPVAKLAMGPRTQLDHQADYGAGAPADLPVVTVPAVVTAADVTHAKTIPPLRLTPLTTVAPAAVADGTRVGPPSMWQSGVKMAVGLAVVLALMMGILALIKRFKVTGFTGRVPMRVLGSVAVGSRQNVVVVEIEGRRLVVGVGPSGMERLADLDTALEIPREGNASAAGDGEGSPSADATSQPRDDEKPKAVETPNNLRKVAESNPFSRALAEADDHAAADVLARTTRDLKRHLQLMRSGSA